MAQTGKTQSMIFYNGSPFDSEDRTDIHCFWCRHPFDTPPRFCPLQYDPEHHRYEVDGIFCSDECATAHIMDNKNNIMYKDSQSLLCRMVRDRTGAYPTHPIQPAPSWKLLSAYGGDMRIEQFRETFEKETIKDTDRVNRPFHCFHISSVYSIHPRWNL